MMHLGNLKVKDLENVTGWIFTEEEKKWLEAHRTDLAGFNHPKQFHIFDMPLKVMCGHDVFDDILKICRRAERDTPSSRAVAFAQLKE